MRGRTPGVTGGPARGPTKSVPRAPLGLPPRSDAPGPTRQATGCVPPGEATILVQEITQARGVGPAMATASPPSSSPRWKRNGVTAARPLSVTPFRFHRGELLGGEAVAIA